MLEHIAHHQLLSLKINMPYAVPDIAAPHSSTGRPGHRRSYTKFTTDEGTSARNGVPKFHFHGDDDESNDSEDADGPPAFWPHQPSTLALRLTPPTSFAKIQLLTSSSPHFPATRPRSASTPVILSNGKPLRSSIKTPHIHTPTYRLRSCSAPAPRSLASVTNSRSSPVSSSPLSSSSSLPDDAPKEVHFPAPDEGLESVVFFKRQGRPANVSLPLEEETETETETDTGQEMRWAGGVGSDALFPMSDPFPFARLRNMKTKNISGSLLGPTRALRYKLYAPGIPRAAEAGSMVLLEGLQLVTGPVSTSAESSSIPLPPAQLALNGTLLARNAVFEKHVFVRFTLDAWQTTSEVSATWVGAGPGSAHPAADQQDAEVPGPGWDRFAFSINLTDEAQVLESCSLVLAARFAAPSIAPERVGPYIWCDCSPHGGTSASGRLWVGTGTGSEWWDNNAGRNYHVGFRVVRIPEAVSSSTANHAEPTSQVRVQATDEIPFSVPDAPSSLPSPACTPVVQTPASARSSSPRPSSPHDLPYPGTGIALHRAPSHPGVARTAHSPGLHNYAAPLKSTLNISTTPLPQPLKRGGSSKEEDDHDRSYMACSLLGGDGERDAPPTSLLKTRALSLLFGEEGIGLTSLSAVTSAATSPL
ncbi:hypothetical protein DFH07DRAFT_824617 [Mycena maculata]|uniref:CBM21 domain-containing protein n=1 Tax=Mycena maculata TaxID=230809 RepID=A0AAD7J0E3_9AGAR|nr:hypothetical protein DFH07DRAFT_824617 [Mycena maculata]